MILVWYECTVNELGSCVISLEAEFYSRQCHKTNQKKEELEDEDEAEGEAEDEERIQD